MGIAKDLTTPQNSTAGYWRVHQISRRKADTQVVFLGYKDKASADAGADPYPVPITQVFPGKVLTAAEAYTLTKALEGSPLAGGVDVLET